MPEYVWLDVKDFSGTKYGDSRPIDNLTALSFTDRVNDMGSFSFTLPLDTQDFDYIQPKRFVEAYSVGDYGRQFLGMGIIENITRSHDSAGFPQMTVTGNGMLRELQYHYIDEHEFRLEYEGTAGTVEEIWSIVPNVSSSGNMFCNAFDGLIGTCSTASMLQKENPFPYDWIYISSLSPFDGVGFELGSACNTNTGSLKAQYYNANLGAGGSWEPVTFTDNFVTTAGSQPFGQSGCVRFAVSQYWDKLGVSTISVSQAGWCGAATSAAYWSGCQVYQVRFWVTTNNATPIDFAEVKVLRTAGTPDALDELAASMVTAPSWSFYDSAPEHCYTATCNLVYAKVSQQTVYDTLQQVAQQTGESFRWHHDSTSPRLIEWLRFDSPRPDVQAVMPSHVVYSSPSTSLNISEYNWQDNLNLVHRIRPYGGGYGQERVDLRLADQVLPTGFSYSTVSGSRLSITRSGTANFPTYWSVTQIVTFPDVVARSAALSAKREAANELALRAVEWLRTNGASYGGDYTFTDSGSPNMAKRIIGPGMGRTYQIACVNAITEARVGDVIRVEAMTGDARGRALTTYDYEYSPNFGNITTNFTTALSNEYMIVDKSVEYNGDVFTIRLGLMHYRRVLVGGVNTFAGRHAKEFAREYAKDAYYFSHTPGLDQYNTAGTGTLARVYVSQGKIVGTVEKANAFTGTVANPTQIVIENGIIVDVT